MTIATTDTNDQLNWARFREGDEQAFARLYQTYVLVLYSYGLKIVRDADTVEDAIQELFADLWRTKERLSEAQSVRFYLFRSLRRKIHRSLHPEMLPIDSFDDLDSDWLSGLPSVETDIITAETTARQTNQLQRWMAQLPARQYEALMLRYYQDFSYAEIAAIMNISEQGARNVVQKSLQTLRRFALIVSVWGVGWVLKNIFD